MIYQGHVLDVLKTLPARSVHTVVTSPPYWALRAYKTDPQVWELEKSCGAHQWSEEHVRVKGGSGQNKGLDQGDAYREARDEAQTLHMGCWCKQCGAWRGELGLEPTPELYISHLIQVFREVRRILRDDGTLWLNIGDCYYSGDRGGYRLDSHRWEKSELQSKLADRGGSGIPLAPNRLPQENLKDKDLVGIPWMLAFALRADGWYLRAENIWAKGLSFCESYAGSVMPESVTDRPTRSHEQVFLLTKSPRYFYDNYAVKEKGVYPAGTQAAKGSGTREGNRRGGQVFIQRSTPDPHEGNRNRQKRLESHGTKADAIGENGRNVQATNPESERRRKPGTFANNPADRPGYATYDGTRNLRTVWAIGVEPFTEAHFATFPPALVQPCIAAGTSERGVCARCGAPYRRIVEQEEIPDEVKAEFEAARASTAEDHGRSDGFTTRRPNFKRKTIGEVWEESCECHADVERAVVMDPFCGSGTTGVVAALMQRRFIGIELNQEYVKMAERRIAEAAPLFNVEEPTETDATQTSLL